MLYSKPSELMVRTEWRPIIGRDNVGVLFNIEQFLLFEMTFSAVWSPSRLI